MRPTVLIPLLGTLAMLPAAPALAGCGGCASSPVLYAQPQVAPILYAQPQPAPVIYAWPRYAQSSCGGCASAGYYGGVGVIETQPRIARQPIYVVNQGPHYSGAGIMVPSLTWSRGEHTGHYPDVGGYPGGYDGGPYADPLGHGYVRRYGYHEQIPAGYSDAPVGPRIITRSNYRYGYRGGYGPRVYGPGYRPMSLRVNGQVRHTGYRTGMRQHRAAPGMRSHRRY
jgi:hypothetical protein